MSSSIQGLQRQLDGLGRSDETYRQLLQEILTHQGLKSHVQSLQGTGLQEFVEFLDRALGNLPVTDDLFRRTLRRLQSTCGNRGVLPSSHRISNGNLSNREGPFTPGDFADTYEAELDGKKVSIKALRPHTQDTRSIMSKIFYREVVLWKRLRHPNIVPFLGIPTTVPPLEIVFDWMENGTITEFVRKYPRVDRVGLLWDVADGLHYLHLCKVVHGNLKGANVLIDKNDHARLTDFGLASITREDTTTTFSPHDQGATGMTTWAAPEILKGGSATNEGDVFTFAMVAVETFTGHPPFVASYQSALYDIMAGKRPPRPETVINDGLWELIQRCWDQDQGRRPATSEILESLQASFPGEREISKPQGLPNTPSVWTLADNGAHADGSAGFRPDPPGQGIKGVDETVIQDPLVDKNPSGAGMGKNSGSMSYSQKLGQPRKDMQHADGLEPQNPSTGNLQATGPEHELPAGDSQRVLEKEAPISTVGTPKTTFRIVRSSRSALKWLGKAFRTTFAPVGTALSRERGRNGRKPA